MKRVKLRILYVGSLGPVETSTHRRWAIERLGNEVIEFDTTPYATSGGSLVSRIRLRTLIGSTIARLNRDLRSVSTQCKPDVVWFDKPTYVWPETVRALRNLGAFTVHFTIDNPFGPRRDPGWRLILKALREYDLHLVQRDINLNDYHRAGARDVMLMRTAYEPTLHYPPPKGWSDADRNNDVVFVGAPYDNRLQFVIDLWHQGVPLKIWGSHRWGRELPADAKAALWQGGELWNNAYREAFWRSRICLSFVTHSNCDDVAHKSFEIVGCGGFLLAEDTPGHRAHFVDGEEAVLFHSVEDCAEKIRRYLPDEKARTRIARAGRRRAEISGYSNDARIKPVLDYVASRLKAR